MASRQTLSDNVLASIHVLSNRITRAFEAKLDSEHGLSVPEWRVLLSVSHDVRPTAKDIHEAWAMDKMTVSRAVRRLDAKRLLRRVQSRHDRRRYELESTPRGARLIERILPTADARYHEILSCLTSRERAQFRKMLSKLTKHSEGLD